ncbi:MAG: hypothetical protein HY056_12500 [Proteobacteria bacterium]|nr:hypothetical protein [Pseudomonadota bacterium]
MKLRTPTTIAIVLAVGMAAGSAMAQNRSHPGLSPAAKRALAVEQVMAIRSGGGVPSNALIAQAYGPAGAPATSSRASNAFAARAEHNYFGPPPPTLFDRAKGAVNF